MADIFHVPIIFIYKFKSVYSGYLKSLSKYFFEYNDSSEIASIIERYLDDSEKNRASMTKKIYVGCALTQAPDDFKQSIENFKNELRPFSTILDFVGLVNGTAKDVFEWDTNCVKSCDIFIADCTFQGIGLGYELGIALESQKNVLAIAHEDATVSRLVLGVTSPKYQFIRYKNVIEVLPRVKELLK